MRILYEDDMYPGTVKAYKGKTIGQILASLPGDAKALFIKRFNNSNKNMCLSDEVGVVRRYQTDHRFAANKRVLASR